MDKKLPGIFANKIDKPLTNNTKVAYGSKEEIPKTEGKPKPIVEKNIHQKLREIFASSRYVYKADVQIVTKDGTFQKKVIGQNQTHLITIDNDLIPITDLIDISFVEDDTKK